MIYLFGSCARGTVRRNSDIDLCVIMDFTDKRELLADMYMNLELEVPFDIVLYSEALWEEKANEEGSFANKIKKEGSLSMVDAKRYSDWFTKAIPPREAKKCWMRIYFMY